MNLSIQQVAHSLQWPQSEHNTMSTLATRSLSLV